jgi:hypothetical protein
MIYETLQILKEQLEAYFSDEGLGKIIAVENIALLESGNEDDANLKGKVVLTLINIEEETTLKNIPNYKVKNGITEYKNPPVHLNLFLLISANCEKYDKSLRSISKVIQFFQGKNTFTSSNAIFNRNNQSLEEFDSFKFILELYTPSFEELNYVWGTLGGRQLPSVLYKIQLIKIEQDKKQAESEAITHIGGNLKKK